MKRFIAWTFLIEAFSESFLNSVDILINNSSHALRVAVNSVHIDIYISEITVSVKVIQEQNYLSGQRNTS